VKPSPSTIASTVVSTAPTKCEHHRIAPLRHRRQSLNESTAARPISAGSKVRIACLCLSCQCPASSRQRASVFDDRPSASAGTKVNAPTSSTVPISNPTNSACASQRAARGWHSFFAQAAGDGQHCTTSSSATATSLRRGRSCRTACCREPGKGTSVVVAGRMNAYRSARSVRAGFDRLTHRLDHTASAAPTSTRTADQITSDASSSRRPGSSCQVFRRAATISLR